MRTPRSPCSARRTLKGDSTEKKKQEKNKALARKILAATQAWRVYIKAMNWLSIKYLYGLFLLLSLHMIYLLGYCQRYVKIVLAKIFFITLLNEDRSIRGHLQLAI